MNTRSPERAGLFFRGDRHYIQGSLIITRAAAYLSAALPDLAGVTVREAKFNRILDRAAAFTLDVPDAERAVAEVRFAGPRGTVSIYLVERAGSAPERVADSPKVISAIGRNGLSATARFDAGPPSLDGVLRGAVELQKFAIEAGIPGSREIMFLALFDASLPVEDAACSGRGSIVIRNVAHRPQSRPPSTISQFTIEDELGRSCGGKLVFSYA